MSGSPSRTSNLTRHGAGISTLALPGVDIVSMTRGDGEWRNMQEIVRRTLKVAFETIDKQAKQIGRLTGQIASLQSQQQKIVSRDEILELIEERLERSKLTGKKRYVLRPELESMSIAIAQIKQDLERKASMRYVHDVLRGKIDKSDAVARTLLQQSSDDRSTVTATAEYAATANRTQMSMLFKDLATVKDDVEGLAKLIEAISREMKASNEITDYNIVKKQIESIYASMDDYHTKTYVQALLDQKVRIARTDISRL